MSPPVLVPALVAAPALSTMAALVVLLVLLVVRLWLRVRFASVLRLTVPPVRFTTPLTLRLLLPPVIVADRLPAPEMVLKMLVAAERTYRRLALLLSVTAPTPKVPVLPPLPTCKVPPLMVVVPS